jgi:hypothetical protein
MGATAAAAVVATVPASILRRETKLSGSKRVASDRSSCRCFGNSRIVTRH